MILVAAVVVAGAGLFVLAGATPAALGLLADISERFPADRGAIMGLYSVFLAIGQIIGSLIGGFAADWRGIDGMLIATAVLLAIALIPLSRLRAQEHEIDAGAAGGQPARQRHRLNAILAPVTSNIGQSYPYTSETEAERAERVAALVAAHKELAAKLEAETTPLDRSERWWVWKCPTPGCPGLLHAAGYARDIHAVLRRLRRDLRQDLPALTRRPASRTLAAASRRPELAAGSSSTGSGSSVSAIGFGFVYGLTAARPASRRSRPMAMSIIVFAGAAQFAAVGYVASGLAWPGDHPADGAAQRPPPALLGGPARRGSRGAVRRVARSMAHLLTDEAFALVDQPLPADRPARRARLLDRRRSARRSSPGTWRRWPGSSIGAQIPDPARLGIDVIFPAAMVGLAVGLITGRRELVAAIVGAGVAVGVALVVEPVDRDRRRRRRSDRWSACSSRAARRARRPARDRPRHDASRPHARRDRDARPEPACR